MHTQRMTTLISLWVIEQYIFSPLASSGAEMSTCVCIVQQRTIMCLLNDLLRRFTNCLGTLVDSALNANR